jgi:hypothetical protein
MLLCLGKVVHAVSCVNHFYFFAFVDDRIVLYGEPWFGWVSAMSFLAPEMQILISAKSCAWWTHDICGMDQPG